VVALCLAGFGLFGAGTALWIAFGIGLATLFVEGVRYAGVEHLSGLTKVLTVALNVSLGLVIVALKVALSH
jgi:hypothetical protein